jgi:hypothetical protein
MGTERAEWVRTKTWWQPTNTVMALLVAVTLEVCSGCAGPHGEPPDHAAPAASTVQVTPSVSAASPVLFATVDVPAAPTQGDAVRSGGAGAASLRQGVKLYQAGQYPQAEAKLKQALKAGLSSPKDMARAQKYLAFMYCTSQRESLCAAAFKAARVADPAFALGASEAGHPMWSQVYRKALGLK